MVSLDRFLSNVSSIKASLPTYRTGGTGADGTCDCIGLVMGAMYRAGHKRYDMHSSNYFARYQMQNLDLINSEDDCRIGMILYKRTDSIANLHERYRAGGRYYTGDISDYYHVGVVTGVNPLVITHCTAGNGASGIIVDNKLEKWSRGGRLKDIDYDDYTGGYISMAIQFAKVASENGLPVKLRSSKSTKNESNVLTKLPVGTVVRIQEAGAEWSRIEVSYLGNAYTGFMMSRFLAPSDELSEGSEEVPFEPTLEARFEALEMLVADMNERLTKAGI